MKNISLNINSAKDAEKYILDCEKIFSDELDSAIEEIFEEGEVKIITLSGPTCSGKTTTAKKLTDRIIREGKNAVVLSIDDFFLDRNDRNSTDGEAPDYDSVKAIDLECLDKFTHDLLRGNTVYIPHYSFPLTSRTGYTEYIPRENDIYVFEGIQAVYPEVTSMFGKNYRSVFISVEDDVCYHGAALTKDEIRLLRRLVRDYKFRNSTAEFTYHLWSGVRANEETNIFPNAVGCDIHINSLLLYEPFIISDYASEIIKTIPAGSRYRADAEELLSKLAEFSCPYFDSSMIPSNSVYREFIG